MVLIFIEKIKSLVLTKAFLLGVVLTVGVFSKYIFGNDNLLEEMAEFAIQKETGATIDFSDDSKNSSEDFKFYKSLYRKF